MSAHLTGVGIRSRLSIQEYTVIEHLSPIYTYLHLACSIHCPASRQPQLCWLGFGRHPELEAGPSMCHPNYCSPFGNPAVRVQAICNRTYCTKGLVAMRKASASSTLYHLGTANGDEPFEVPALCQQIHSVMVCKTDLLVRSERYSWV